MSTARLPSLTYTGFRHHLLSNTPVLLPSSATSAWPAFKLWLKDGTVDFAYLHERYGSETVTAVDCGSWESEEKSFGEVLSAWEAAQGERVYVKVGFAA